VRASTATKRSDDSYISTEMAEAYDSIVDFGGVLLR
jgi:hypothetical protein